MYIAATKTIAAASRAVSIAKDLTKIPEHPGPGLSGTPEVEKEINEIKTMVNQGNVLVVKWILADLIVPWLHSIF